jgi:hypothetical protein
MFDAAHKANNGVMVQYVDMGTEYTHNGHTMLFVGEQQSGEVVVDGVYYAEYMYDDESDTNSLYNDERGDEAFATIGNTDEAYEAYALQVLQAL